MNSTRITGNSRSDLRSPLIDFILLFCSWGFPAVQELKRKLQLADDFSTFLSRPISKTQMRLTCTTIIDRMEQAWKEWDTHIPQFYEAMPSDISAAAAEDDLAVWLEKVEIEDPDIAGGHQHEDDRGYLHPKINFSDVELYRCSWCRNPSALLKKCKACEKARFVPSMSH